MTSDKHHRVLVVAPTGRDAQLLHEVLGRNGIVSECFADVRQLCEELRDGSGAILLAEEALGPGALEHLSTALGTQPKWSGLPIIVLTTNWQKMEVARQMFRQKGVRGDLVILEKPVRPLSLCSTLDAALTSRARQYEVRDYLDQRSRTEELLRKANERLEMILNSITDRFFAFDEEWRFTYFNKHAEEQLRLIGKEPASLIGKVLWDEFPSPAADEALHRAMSERVAITCENYYLPLKEWLEHRIYPSPDGGLAIFQRYITERKRAEEALRESEERYRLLVEGVRDYAIFTLDVGGHVASWNRGAERIKGYRSDEIIGEHFSRLYPAEDVQDGKPQLLLRRAAGKGRCEDEGWRIRKDGTRFWANVVITALTDGEGRVRGFSNITRDITERRLAEETLHEARAELAHISRVTMMGQLAASIAHEVNQPLGALVSDAGACLEWLGGAQPNIAETRTAVARIIEQGMRAGEVVARIRSLMKKGLPQMAIVDMNETIKEVLTLTRHEIARYKISLRTNLAIELFPARGDIIQLRQVLVNLILNAIESMGMNSNQPRQLLITSQNHGLREILIAVRDSGVGVDPEKVEELFKPFVTSKPQGIGMGLTISRSIIESCGGRLWAAPNEGRGATLEFSLPAANRA
ncbi:MAG TPA: PAS domain S-box protein [Acidobacteriaceae bacterium]|jgi:PAS domain S-box-containing protein